MQPVGPEKERRERKGDSARCLNGLGCVPDGSQGVHVVYLFAASLEDIYPPGICVTM